MDHMEHDFRSKKERKMLPSLKTRPPAIYPHLELKLKHFEIEQQRHKIIEAENRRLLKALITTAQGHCSFDIRKDHDPKRLNGKQTKESNKTIARENELLARRLIEVKSTYNITKFEQDWNTTEKVMTRISRYEHGWRTPQANRRTPNLGLNQTKDKPCLLVTPASPRWLNRQHLVPTAGFKMVNKRSRSTDDMVKKTL